MSKQKKRRASVSNELRRQEDLKLLLAMMMHRPEGGSHVNSCTDFLCTGNCCSPYIEMVEKEIELVNLGGLLKKERLSPVSHTMTMITPEDSLVRYLYPSQFGAEFAAVEWRMKSPDTVIIVRPSSPREIELAATNALEHCGGVMVEHWRVAD